MTKTTTQTATSLALAFSLALGSAGCAMLGLRSGSADGPELVEVDLDDTHVHLAPSHVQEGRVDFAVSNHGNLAHSLQVEGAKAEEQPSETFSPIQPRRFRMKLAPGTYRVFCPDGDHAARGMEATLSVTAAEGPGR